MTGSVGINVYHSGDHLEVILGGTKEYRGASGGMLAAGMVGAVAVPLATGGTYRLVPNPTMYSYSSYTNSRSVYFTCLFDRESLEHIEGEPEINPFDKIKSFTDEIKSALTTQTIFKVDDYYVLGYYAKDEEKYYLRKFE